MSSDENKELRKLININEDACEFYESAQEKAENPRMKTAFGKLEGLHKEVIINLQGCVRANGGDPEAEETLTGQVQKFWGELVTKISSDVDETLVAHLEDAEDRCLSKVRDVIDSDAVSPSTKQALYRELETLQNCHDYMKTLKDSMEAS